MNFAGLIFLLITHYLSGSGCLRLIRLEVKPIPLFCLSLMAGVPLLSFAPCILQLLNIPIDSKSVYISIAAFTAVFCIPLLVNFKIPKFKKIAMPGLYEWPFLIVCMMLIIISVWRCFYFPPYARDMLSGPELLAEFAVREKTMVSSVFTVELQTTNNYLKSPFITSLQIIYKLLVSPFGQVWLSVLFVSFMGWLYTLLRERIHPLLAAFLLMFFLMMPDVYAYSYILLYDYSNMIFFFCGFYFIIKYVDNDRLSDLICSAFLFGLATYIRTETLALIVMIMPVPAFYFYKKRVSVQKAAIRLGIFLAFPVAFYFICMNLFVRNFVPFSFDVASQVKFSNISFFFERLNDMNTKLIFSPIGIEIYGYFFYFFCGLLLIDLIFFRRFSRKALIVLYGIAVVYIGMALLGYLVPLVDLLNTTKRGLFKALPLMLLYMADSALMQRISQGIKTWEYALPGKKPVTKPVTKPGIKQKQKKK